MSARSHHLDHPSVGEITAVKWERLRHALPIVVGLALLAVALHVLRVELGATNWTELTAAIFGEPRERLALAIALTALNYTALTGYDQLAFLYIGKRLPRWKIALTSFFAYGIANTVGFGLLSGVSVRYHMYTRWGVTAEELSRIVVSYGTSFWLGLFALGGCSLIVTPLAALRELPAHQLVTAAGWVLMAIPIAYVTTAAFRRKPIRVWRLDLPIPSARIAVAQVGLSSIDWALAGGVLYILLPSTGLSFIGFLGLFFVAILLGIASHVPGGVGVFEGLMVLFLKPYLASNEVLPALVVFRGVYYLLPFTIAATGLVVDDLYHRRHEAARGGATLGRLTEQLTPRVMAAAVFVSGLVLLFSGATPASAARLAWLSRVLPLQVTEASHFLASVAGCVLLLLSQGIARRLDGAYHLASAVLIVGITTSLLKGFDYEEAALLLAVLAILWRARRAFDRRAAFFETRFSAGWVVAVIGAVGASIWLGLFAYKHVEYSTELWWQFELQGDASRFLRASVGAAVVLLLVAFARLIGRAPHAAPAPTAADLQDAAGVIATQPSTSAYLALVGDKALLFDDTRSAFVMYAVQGRTWAALGDPIGPQECHTKLLRRFLERCADFGGTPVFYEISGDHLHRYADLGFTFVKLGEEARVDLAAFNLDSPRASGHRKTMRRLQKAGGVFRIVEAADLPAIMSTLRAISDDWLASKAGGEKGFSLGFFDEGYLSRFPAAVIERDGQIVAFTNLWLGQERIEFSIDLMRYHHDAPNGVMEALLLHLMQWGKQQGYRWFVLGMAPLSGVEPSPIAPLWNRFGAFLYHHGDVLYKFQGLRAYKEKFDPVWEPHYLAYPGGLRLPRILADVSALVAGGYRRILIR